jgi:hypothetical protein
MEAVIPSPQQLRTRVRGTRETRNFERSVADRGAALSTV